MSDGRVVIDIEAEGSAAIRELNDVERAAEDIKGGTKKASVGIGDMVKAMGLVKVASAAFGVVKSAVGGLMGDLESGSATWKTFTGNMENIGKSKSEIASVKKEMQDFATKTIYSASDMATTYVQLEAVGIKSADQLVKGFGGLAAAAENPTQAMKTLSQQATQMASKPQVAWEDFKLILEQTPAGVAAVAKTMGMSTSEMVTAVQDGKIATQDFFDAITKTGNSDAFMNMATQYKTVGQAMDGLQETLITKLQPTYDKVSAVAIKGVEKIIEVIEKVDFDKIFNAIESGVKKAISAFNTMTKFVKDNATAFKILAGVVASVLAGVLAFGAVNSVVSTFGKLKSAVAGLKGGFAALKATLLANPFALIIAAIAALTVAFVLAYKNSETFRKKVDGIVKTFKDFSAPIGDVLKGIQLLAKAFKAIVLNDFSTNVLDLHNQFVKLFPESLWKGMTSFAQKVKGVVQGLATLAKGFKAIAFDDWSVNVAALKANFLEVFPESLWNGMTKLALGIRSLINGFKDGAKGVDPFKIAFTVLKSVVLGLLGPIGLVIKAVMLVAKALGGGDVQKGFESILGAFDGLTKGIQKNAPMLGKSFGQALQGMLTAIGQALPGIIVGGLQIVAGLIVGIAQGLPLITSAAIQLIMAFTASMLTLIPVVGAAAVAIITSILTTIATAMPDLIVAGASVLLSFITGLTQVIPSLVTATVNLIVTFLNSIAANLPLIIASGTNLLIKFITGITNELPALGSSVTKLIVTFLGVITKNLPKILTAAVELMTEFIDGLISKMPQIVSSATRLIVSFLGEIANNLQDIIDAGVNLVVKLVEGIGNNVDDIVKAAGDLVDKLVQGIIDIADRMAKAAIKLINGLADGIRENADDVKGAAENLLDAILEAIPGGGLIQTGRDIASGLADGISEGWDWVSNAAKDLADKAVSSAKKALDSHSPSKKFIKIGKDTGAGMAIGIDDGSKVAIKSSKAMATDVIEASSKALKLSSRARAGFDRLNLGVGKTAGLASAAQMITNAVTNNSNSSTKNSNNKAEVNIYTEVKSNTPTERELARQTKVQLRDLGYSFG